MKADASVDTPEPKGARCQKFPDIFAHAGCVCRHRPLQQQDSTDAHSPQKGRLMYAIPHRLYSALTSQTTAMTYSTFVWEFCNTFTIPSEAQNLLENNVF